MKNFNAYYLVALSALCISGAAMASQYDGNWTSGCYSQSAQGQTLYGKNALDITGTTIKIDSSVFGDASCSSKSPFSDEEIYELSTSSSNVAGADNLDLILQEVTITLQDPQYIAVFNAQKMCGLTNWALNVPQNVTGASCGGQAIPKAGDLTYSLIGIDTSGKLLMGKDDDSHTGISEATRPTLLDTTVPYTKE